jgi:hypothetical protein
VVRSLAVVGQVLLLAGDAVSAPRTRCPAGTGFARLASVESGGLLVLDMPGCNGRVLVERGARPPVRWSADGRYASFSGGVVSVESGRMFPGLSGIWSPRGHLLAAITTRGGVVLHGPGLRRRRVLPDGFGAQSVVFDPSGVRLAVSRARFRGTARPVNRQIWIVGVGDGARRRVYAVSRRNARTAMVAAWPPGEFVVFTLPLLPAISVNLDGLPLHAVDARGGRPRRIVPGALTYDEFRSVCRRSLVVAAGFDCITTRSKRLVAAAPPRWQLREVSRDHRRSWIAPACSPDGRTVAVSAGPNRLQSRFGLERRSIWLLSLDGCSRRRLTAPPRGQSDELPRWNAEGTAVFFVRSGTTRPDATARGSLYVVRLQGQRPERVADDLGRTRNYYGRYGWADQTDLFLPRVR